jgi:hypothetical protein
MPGLSIAARMRRAVVVSAVVMAGFGVFAGAANAAILSMTPTIQGAGTITGSWISWNGAGSIECVLQVGIGAEPTNSSTTQCPQQTAESQGSGNNITFGTITLTATPIAGWAFQDWTGCPIPQGTECKGLVSDTNLTFTPKARFAEIVPVTVNPLPPAFTNDPRLPLSFSSTAASTTFTCTIDGGPSLQCPPPFTPPGALQDGMHAVKVTGKHNGDLSLDPVTVNFTVDTAAPTAALTSGPGQGALQAVKTETFGFTSTEPGTFQCRLDAAAFSACTSPVTLTNLSADSHTFQVRAVDRAGNLGAPASRSWSVAPADGDNDGFNERVDCNDADPTIHPGATDTPDDGIYQDCNGADAHAAPVALPLPQPLPIITTPSAPQVINVTLSFFATKAGAKSTTFSRLQVKSVPRGATVTVKCTGKGCPKGLTKSGFVKKNASGTVSLAAFIKKAIPTTSTITVTVSKPGFTSAVKTLKIRKSKSPEVTTRCLPAGAKKPVSC